MDCASSQKLSIPIIWFISPDLDADYDHACIDSERKGGGEREVISSYHEGPLYNSHLTQCHYVALVWKGLLQRPTRRVLRRSFR